MKSNRHDQWQRCVTVNQDVLDATGLPTELFTDEYRFTEFLTTGSIEISSTGMHVKLAELTDEVFLRLEKAVKKLIDSQFFAFDQERLRRFKRYG